MVGTSLWPMRPVPAARLGVRVTVAYAVLLGVWDLARAHQVAIGQVDGLLILMGVALALVLGFAPASRAAVLPTRPLRWVAPLLQVALLLMVGAQLLWGYLWQQSGGRLPYPSAADACFLAAYPFLIGAVALLPRRPRLSVMRTRLVLEALSVAIAAATVSWYFLLGPLVLQRPGPLLPTLVSLAHPGADLAFGLCWLLVRLRIDDRWLRPVGSALGMAVLALLVADSSYSLHLLWGAAVVDRIQVVGWPAAYALIGLAVYLLRRQLPAIESDQPREAALPDVPLWRIFAPYAPIPVLVALGWLAKDQTGILVAGVYLGGAAFLALLLVRQALVLLENRQLYHRLNAAYHAMAATQAALQTGNQALAEANAHLTALSASDPLTHLPNQRALTQALTRELERARRYRHPCTVLFIDLDHFKHLNDTYGHPAGDAALRDFGQGVSASLRSADTVGRWGGEEFLAILPETGAAAGLVAAERLRQVVAAQLPTPEGRPLTCSIGVASYPDDADNRSDLIAAADRALYLAKRRGRDQVCAASDPALRQLETGDGESRPDAAEAERTNALAGAA